MKESVVERRLRIHLERHGFKVLKLITSHAGAMDRIILRPKWSPGPPWVVECKRPGQSERRLQELLRDDWRERGIQVLDCCDTIERVDDIERQLLATCKFQRIDGL